MIYKISSTCFEQSFAHLQGRKTEIFTAYDIVSCCCGRQGFGERQRGTTVPRCRSLNPSLPQQQDAISYAVKISVLRSWRSTKDCPKHVELILEINKLLLLYLVGFSILFYVHWWCTFKHKWQSVSKQHDWLHIVATPIYCMQTAQFHLHHTFWRLFYTIFTIIYPQ